MDSKAINKEMYALYIDYMCRLSGENLHQILQNFGLNRRPNERLPLYKRTSRRNASISSSSTSSSSSSTGVISKVTKMATANLSNPVQNLMQNYQLQLHANHQSDKRVYIHHQEQTLAQYQQYNYSRAYTAYEVLPREYLCPEEVLYQNHRVVEYQSIPPDQYSWYHHVVFDRK